MLLKMKLNVLQRTFDDVYGSGLNPTNYTSPEYTDKRIDASSSNVYVHNCVFRSCTSSTHGGALYCSSNVLRLLVEQSSYISCTTTNSYGAGIYFCNTASGECILSKVCGFDCSSTKSGSTGQFCYIYTNNNNVNSRNHVNDSSITRTSNRSTNIYIYIIQWIFFTAKFYVRLLT
jgi:hypothetical protein